ncbi:MAG: response regulator transcription factor [Roseivirga sp.]|nr:response regulator transcription factor [Roseivirga sp.]
MIHCLILEDEPAAVEVLKSYIDKTPFIECIGIYESGLDISPDEISRADLLFLDVHLPELNGISFLKSLEEKPRVIITTAYADYAVEAFEEEITDYLVKPYSYERFCKATIRVREQLSVQEKKKGKQLLLYADKTTYKIRTTDILYLKAEVDYVKFVTANQQILILDSLQNWEEKLAASGFVRTHRSYIVNLEKIEKISRNQVFIRDEIIPIGRTYKDRFIENLTRE